MGERLGGYIYGTIVVIATIVSGARAYTHSLGHVAVLVFLTTVVFWLAHVYAHSLAQSVREDRHLSRAMLLGIARHESSIIEAALIPVGILMLGHFGVIKESTDLWLAIGAGLVALVIQGLAFARAERLGTLGTAAIVAANLGLGVALVGLKLWVGHPPGG
jgi:hypothetical protein